MTADLTGAPVCVSTVNRLACLATVEYRQSLSNTQFNFTLGRRAISHPQWCCGNSVYNLRNVNQAARCIQVINASEHQK
jgi:hypothetical protein